MILIIAEKAQAAKKIAAALAEGKVNAKNYKKHPYYEITWNGKEVVVVPLRGHIMSYDYPAEYNKWSKIPPKDLIEVDPNKKLKSRTIAQTVKKFDPDLIIHACDADAEGENIGFEAIDLLSKPAKRAWFHSLAKDELKKSFEKLKEPDENLSNSIDARMIIDLMFGAVLTREVTMGISYKRPISVGRCQTPTLKFLVDKELNPHRAKDLGIIIASGSRMAADAVSVALMRYHGVDRVVERSVWKHEQFKYAEKRKLGKLGLDGLSLKISNLADDSKFNETVTGILNELES